MSVKKGDFVLDSIDGLWKAYDNSFMVRIKTHKLSGDFLGGGMLQFSANVELAGGRLPFATELMQALKHTDLYGVMPSRPGKCLIIVDCMCPTVTGSCLIHGRVQNGVRVQSTDGVGRYDNRPDKQWGSMS